MDGSTHEIYDTPYVHMLSPYCGLTESAVLSAKPIDRHERVRV